MKTILLTTSIVILTMNFAFAQNDDQENVTCEQAVELIKKNSNDANFVILDLRSDHMYNEGHIENAIYHDVFDENFKSWVSELDKNKVYLLYCNAGGRSGIALNTMKELGFKNLYHMNEGIKGWKSHGFTTVQGEE